MASESALGNELRIVLLGKTGAGKSSAGNTILGREAFKKNFSLESCTQMCERQEGTVQGRSITVIDTPGIFDTSMNEKETKCEIVKCIYQSAPGPHVFLVVISLRNKFTEEERKAVEWVQKNFGEAASRYIMVLFTGGDELDGRPVQEIFTSSVSELIHKCGDRYCVFNNKERDDPTQVTELLRKIEEMVEKNGGQHYTNEMFMEAQQKLLTVTEWLIDLGRRLIQRVKDKGTAPTAALEEALAAIRQILISATAYLVDKPKEIIWKTSLEAVQKIKEPASRMTLIAAKLTETIMTMEPEDTESPAISGPENVLKLAEIERYLASLIAMKEDPKAAFKNVITDVTQSIATAA